MPAADITPPVLKGFTLPASVDLTHGDASVTFGADATDVGTGVKQVALELDHSIQGQYGLIDWIYVNFPGPELATTATLFKAATGSGTYTITAAVVTDNAGNTTVYEANQLKSLGIGTSFVVASNTAADITPPVLKGFTLPASVDLTHGDASVTFGADATDVGTGVKQVALELDHSIQGQYGLIDWIYVNFSGSELATTATLFKAATGSGTYTITAAVVTDNAGNTTVYEANQLKSLGIGTSFVVASNTAADITPPLLKDLTLPASVDITHGDVSVNFGADATDVGTGVKQVALELDHSIQGQYGLIDWIYVNFSGSELATTATLFKAATGSGTYNITAAVVTDNAGNTTVYEANQLKSLGVGTTFQVKDGLYDPYTLSDATIVTGTHTSVEIFSLNILPSEQVHLQFSFDSAELSFSDATFSGASSTVENSSTVGSRTTIILDATASPVADTSAPIITLNFATSGNGVFDVSYSQVELNDVPQTIAVGPSIKFGISNGSNNINEVYGSSANDNLTGISGINEAIFSGTISEYSITSDSQSTVVTDNILGRDGSDTLNNIQQVKFSDYSLIFDLQSSKDLLVYEIYQAAYNRTPDNAGYRYWASVADANQTPALALADAFLGAPEFTQIYGSSPSNLTYVTELYQHVLARAPDQGGLDYWVGRANAGEARDQLLIDFATSPENVSLIGPHISNGYWTTH